MIIEVSAPILSTEGGDKVTLRGQNFGVDLLALSITYANFKYSAVNCELVQPHTTLICESVPGVGFNHTWVITAGGQVCQIGRLVAADRSNTGPYACRLRTRPRKQLIMCDRLYSQ